MTITKLNYEVYALDYLEGTLSKEAQKAMERFLLGHPEIAVELEAMREIIPLTPDPLVTFQYKEKLLKKESKTRILFFRKWQLGAAAAIALLIAFTSLWNVNFFAGQEIVADVDISKNQEKVQIPKEISAVSPQAKEEVVNRAVFANAAEIKKIEKEEENTEVVNKTANQLKTTTKTGSSINSIVSNQPSTINSIHPKSKNGISESYSDTVNGGETITNQQSAIADATIKNTIEVSTQSKEEVATIIGPKQISNHPTVPIVAALPLADIKEIKGISDFKEFEITPDHSRLLAESTPRRRTLKSMLGKLPGDRIGVSILPSFFTDKGD